MSDGTPARPRVEVFGVLQGNLYSEIERTDAAVDRRHVGRYASLHEDAGFDGVLIGTNVDSEDSLVLASYLAARTERLRFLVAHRPGPVSPTLAARQLATLDQLSDGRVHVHVITSRDEEPLLEGDTLDKARRYDRTAEHIRFLRAAWTSAEALDFRGEHYRVQGYRARVRPHQERIEISFAGNSDAAKSVGSELADHYALYPRPLADQRRDIAGLRTLAAANNRFAPLRFTMIVRPVLAETDELAWERAAEIKRRALEVSTAKQALQQAARRGTKGKPSAGDQQLFELNASQGERHDSALWTGVTAISERANSTALVGSPETVAGALAAYHAVGIDRFIIHGFESYYDVATYGRELIPRLRDQVDHFDSKEYA